MDEAINYTLPTLPSELQRLWYPFDTPLVLPANHRLTHFNQSTFPNHITLHRTLLDLHMDYLEGFWPTLEFA